MAAGVSVFTGRTEQPKFSKIKVDGEPSKAGPVDLRGIANRTNQGNMPWEVIDLTKAGDQRSALGRLVQTISIYVKNFFEKNPQAKRCLIKVEGLKDGKKISCRIAVDRTAWESHLQQDFEGNIKKKVGLYFVNLGDGDLQSLLVSLENEQAKIDEQEPSIEEDSQLEPIELTKV